MNLLNESWPEYERRLRRLETRRRIATVVYGLVCVLVGLVIGYLIL